MILTSPLGKAGIIAAIVAGVVKYLKRSHGTVSSPSELYGDIAIWFNNDLRGMYYEINRLAPLL